LVDAQGRIVFSYAHPLFWAPFTLVGDGGGTPGALTGNSTALSEEAWNAERFPLEL
jgi:hypothetical protein